MFAIASMGATALNTARGIAASLTTRAAAKATADVAIAAVAGAALGAAAVYLLGGQRVSPTSLGLDPLVGEKEDRKEVLDQVAVQLWAETRHNFIVAHDAEALPKFLDALYRFEKRYNRATLNVLLATLCIDPAFLVEMGREPTVAQLEEVAAPLCERYHGRKDPKSILPDHKEAKFDGLRQAMANCIAKNILVMRIVQDVADRSDAQKAELVAAD